ncbi:hypothetical protein MK851_12150 [Tenacibaculum sp. 1B UA]|uniref:hypothetical protein n=1 Tax=Tenacibaculum sp. 1B UA TaxID=2922252 RepID=UPI002A23D797|nr:hypothetical protein [Tenacibaculum sp. 1B UA]MDX8554372.1 hypothetical protein [Tenacibaculum sp. 1B UA]
MVRIIVYITIFIISSFFSIISAQNVPTIPCNEIDYTQFDFWVENGNIYNTEGELIGNNNVIKMPNACAVQKIGTQKHLKEK